MENAMRQRDALKLTVLRGLLASFTNEAVANGKKPDQELDDSEALVVIKRASKQRLDSMEQFKKGNRNDLAEKEEKELLVIKEYLPEMMSIEEIQKIAMMKKEEMGIVDKSKIGILVGAIMKETAGRADGADVKKVLEGLFS